MSAKIPWKGNVVSVQPRIRLMRSFDERAHTYLGYNLTIEGEAGDYDQPFIIAIGKSAQAKYEFKAGDMVQGMGSPVISEKQEVADLYKVSKLKVLERSKDEEVSPPPFFGSPFPLDYYRARGHRRLDAKTYNKKCFVCVWGCKMPVEMIIDHWNPSKKRYRMETWCYGPKSCPWYRAGPKRKAPGRKSWMVYVEEDWMDEQHTAHRGENE